MTSGSGAAAGAWPARRFSQAISEGDGISIMPVLGGDVTAMARSVEAGGAEAIVVEQVEHVGLVRGATGLPILVRCAEQERGALERARELGADAFSLVCDAEGGGIDGVAALIGVARAVGLDCALEVRTESELAEVMELLDPEIVVLSDRDPLKAEADPDRMLRLLPDVPAGKLVVSTGPVETREHVLALEDAGVDALIVEFATGSAGADTAVAELVGDSGPLR
ncbi:MAG: hypothetical protein OXG37_16385 [Actinomycetia bacterium]|nr:hypothetical protein [Actinomycetes bacterium]